MKPHCSTGSAIEYPGAHGADRASGQAVVCAVLMPHAPVLVPGVGGERGGSTTASGQAMCTAARCVLDYFPETVVLISPHSPRQPRAFGIWADDLLQGSFAELAAPQVEVSLPSDQTLAHAIAVEMHTRGLATWSIRHRPIDHGAMVPLWFLAEAGWTGPTVILSLNHSGGEKLSDLGEAIAAAAKSLSRRIAIIASGDMSHRLADNAPCGFHPQAHEFDEDFIRLIRAGDYQKLEAITPELRELAAEDAVDTTLIAVAAANWQTTGHRILSYEAPFGVGYGVAILFADSLPTMETAAPVACPDKSQGATLPSLARKSVETALCGSYEFPPPPTNDYLKARRGVFVTLRQLDGQVRGCMGTVAPACPNVIAETWRSARLAALHDRRFSPVTIEELAEIRFEVSVLYRPEQVSAATELDPSHYGVIVSAADGRRGLLLPGIQGITTSEQQLQIAREKGWICPDEPVTVQHFQTDHFEERMS